MDTLVDDLSQRLALRIKLERDGRGWSLAELAERAGVSKATISKIERAEVSPTAVVLVRLASAFDLTLAGLMLRAMIQAAKSDGTIDEAEKQRLLGKLGDDLDDEERQFIRDQMAAPVDPQGLAREVPKGLEPQVYMMSLLAIDFDHEDEARYLRELAQALGLQPAQGGFVELTFPEAGHYPFVNHVMSLAERGARGSITVAG